MRCRTGSGSDRVSLAEQIKREVSEHHGNLTEYFAKTTLTVK